MIQARLASGKSLQTLEKAVQKLFGELSQQAMKAARANTPVRSGRARGGWSESVSRSGFELENSVPYIEQLEKGRSRQAPQGILQPTGRAVRRRFVSETARLKSGRLTR